MLLVLALLLLPKIPLIEVSASRSGIRIEDFILGGTAAFLFVHWLQRRVVLTSAVRWYLGFSLVGVISVAVFGGGAQFFYPLRNVEYLVFYFLGAMLPDRRSLSLLLWTFVIVNVGIMAAQFGGLVGGYYMGGYSMLTETRAIGVASHASEIGLALCICFAFLLPQVGLRTGAALFLLCLGGVLLSGSRAPLAIVGVQYLFYLVWRYAHHFRWLLWSGIPVVLIASVVVLRSVLPEGSLVRERIDQLWVADNLTLVGESLKSVFKGVTGAQAAQAEQVEMYAAAGLDASLGSRLYSLDFALSLFAQRLPVSALIGASPGISGASLDMGYVRLVIEFGFLGALCAVMFLIRACPPSQIKTMLYLAVAINMLTFDVYQSYKVMAVVMLICGQLARGHASPLRLRPERDPAQLAASRRL